MKPGKLSQYFEKAASKRLSAVEASPGRSNQHEFNGSQPLRDVLGTGNEEKEYFPTTFIWLGKDDDALSAEGEVTWYDSRKNQPHRSPEYRLYFPTTEVSERAQEGDLMIIAKMTDGHIMIIIAEADTSFESQLLWLFGLGASPGEKFVFQDIESSDDRKLDLAVRFILDELGVEVEEEKSETEYLDSILEPLKGKLPVTKEFSKLARKSLKEAVDPQRDPDTALVKWMEHEEKLFRRIERLDVENRLRAGFAGKDGKDIDVDGFIKFSLGVQNRRKSRAGHAFENHLEEIFTIHGIKYERAARTENDSRPDFLFPGAKAYHDRNYPSDKLTMLGAKTTCKDRWRQVLAEADKILEKHLLTLEPGISEKQTNEMKGKGLRLVVPQPVHTTYTENQQPWLMTVTAFLDLVKGRQ